MDVGMVIKNNFMLNQYTMFIFYFVFFSFLKLQLQLLLNSTAQHSSFPHAPILSI